MHGAEYPSPYEQALSAKLPETVLGSVRLESEVDLLIWVLYVRSALPGSLK